METKTTDATLSTRTLLWVISITIEVKEDDHDQFENDKRKKRRKKFGEQLKEKIEKEKKRVEEERKTRGGKKEKSLTKLEKGKIWKRI